MTQIGGVYTLCGREGGCSGGRCSSADVSASERRFSDWKKVRRTEAVKQNGIYLRGLTI